MEVDSRFHGLHAFQSATEALAAMLQPEPPPESVSRDEPHESAPASSKNPQAASPAGITGDFSQLLADWGKSSPLPEAAATVEEIKPAEEDAAKTPPQTPEPSNSEAESKKHDGQLDRILKERDEQNRVVVAPMETPENAAGNKFEPQSQLQVSQEQSETFLSNLRAIIPVKDSENAAQPQTPETADAEHKTSETLNTDGEKSDFTRHLKPIPKKPVKETVPETTEETALNPPNEEAEPKTKKTIAIDESFAPFTMPESLMDTVKSKLNAATDPESQAIAKAVAGVASGKISDAEQIIAAIKAEVSKIAQKHDEARLSNLRQDATMLAALDNIAAQLRESLLAAVKPEQPQQQELPEEADSEPVTPPLAKPVEDGRRLQTLLREIEVKSHHYATAFIPPPPDLAIKLPSETADDDLDGVEIVDANGWEYICVERLGPGVVRLLGDIVGGVVETSLAAGRIIARNSEREVKRLPPLEEK